MKFLQAIVLCGAMAFSFAAEAQTSVTNYVTNYVTIITATTTNYETNIVGTVSSGTKESSGQTMATNAVGQVLPITLSSNLLKTLGAPPGLQDTWQAIFTGLSDAVPYLPNRKLSLEAGALYDPSLLKGKVGGFADITVPIPGATQAEVGIGTAYLNQHWLNGSVSIKLGTTVNLPGIGAWYGYAAVGPLYDLQAHAFGSYSFAGLVKKFKVWSLPGTVGFGVGNFSTSPGIVMAGGASLLF